MFRIFWSDNKLDRKTYFIKDADGAALARHTKRSGGVDCYMSLNVYPDFEAEPSHYDLGFDFDSGDVVESARDAYCLSGFFRGTGIPHRIFFSGSKGFHIVIPHQLTGIAPRVDGGHVMKLFCADLTATLALSTLDNTIHGKKRMWRITNTLNSKSGLYKIEISKEALGSVVEGGLATVKALAVTPQPTTRIVDLTPNAALVAMIAPFVTKANAENVVRAKRMAEKMAVEFKSVPVCIAGILNDPQRVVRQAQTWQKTVPSRNNLTYIAATFFKSHRGYSEDESNEILGSAWQDKVAVISNSSPSAIARSTLTTIRAVYAGSDNFSCGYAISRGCNCWPQCPLFRKNDGRRTETQANGTGSQPDAAAEGLDK